MRRLMRRLRARSEAGFVAAWTALMILLLLGFAGFAVDVGNWYATGARLQKAADSAALGGVVFMPGDFGNAQATAQTIAKDNGYTNGSNATVVVGGGDRPSQLKVTVTTTVSNFFATVFGMDQTEIVRYATAEFEGPVPMGSPENFLGNEPVGTDPNDPNDAHWADPGANTAPQLWVNLAGPNGNKVNGDRYATKRCSSGNAGCSGTTNQEYSGINYHFATRIKAVEPGKDLVIQVFDAAFTQMGDTCNDSSLDKADKLTSAYPDAKTRYAKGPGPFCTGDHKIGGSGITTTYIVRRPDESPWNDNDNPPVTSPSCAPRFFPSYNGGTEFIKKLLDPGDGNYNPFFASHFRRWFTICRIPAGAVEEGDYIVQIRSNASQGDPFYENTSITDEGHNRFSMRAAFVSGSAATGGNVRLFARGRLPIYANASGADTRFHLARVLPGADGRRLKISLFDTGDASAAGSITILAPTDSPQSFTSCTWSRSDGAPLSSSGCTLNNVQAANGFNGKDTQVIVDMPPGYTCNYNDPRGCWVKIRFTYPSGTNVSDTTTWSVVMLGTPVRLVE